MYRERRFGGYGGGYGSRPSSSPVNVGDEFEVTIEAVGEKGDGIAKKQGFVLFVPNTAKGDRVKIRVTKVLRRMGFAEVVGKGEESPEEEEAEEPVEGEEGAEAPAEPEAEESEEPTEEPEAEEPKDTEDFGEDLEK